jgi:hypothetical protein
MGGGDVPTSGSVGTRVTTAVGALGLAAVLALGPAVGGGVRTRALATLGVIGVIATLAALIWTIRTLTWALLALGAEYAVWWVGRASISPAAALVGAGLLVMAELVLWSVESRSPAWEPWMDRRRIADIAVLSAGSSAVAVLVLVPASLPSGGGAWLAGLGAAAACAALGLVWLLVRRVRPREP